METGVDGRWRSEATPTVTLAADRRYAVAGATFVGSGTSRSAGVLVEPDPLPVSVSLPARRWLLTN